MIVVSLVNFIPLTAQDVENHLASIYSDTAIVHCSRVNFNSTASDFGVTKYKSGYVFASSRNEHVGIQYYSEDSLTPLLDLYYFSKKDSAHFSKPKPFAKELNSKYNDGPATFSHDANVIVFTRTAPAKQMGDTLPMKLTLMISHFQKGKWQKPEVVPFCSGEWNYTHPSFSADDSVLYFTSDRPGGFGGLDIYYSRLTHSGWGTPVNLGKKVNTAYNEEFPFCSDSGNLYFDSDRPGGYGMLDIYAWDMRDSAYTFPQILRGSVNSEADDFGFWCSENGDEGFFSSNRNNSAANDDLYFFKVDWPSPLSYDTIRQPVLCYEFFEEASAATIDTIDMAYQWTFSDGSVMKGYKVSKCFDTTGVYTVSLDIRDSSSGEMFISNRMNFDLEILPPNRISVYLPDTILMNQTLFINSESASANGYQVKAVYYDFGYGYRSRGKTASHVYYNKGTYYPQIFFRVKDEATGIEECRCVIKRIIVE
jgi:hypothetical protein